jgi:hypothetical protein
MFTAKLTKRRTPAQSAEAMSALKLSTKIDGRTVVYALVGLVLGLTLVSQAAAQLTATVPAVSFQTPIAGAGVAQATVGWAFTIEAERTVTHLGIHNWNNGAGFATDRQIAIWDSMGVMVATAILPANGVGAELDGNPFGFYYVALTPNVILSAAEQYTIGVWYNVDNNPGIGINATISTLPFVNYVGPRTSQGTVFEEPIISSTAGGLFGPNLRFSDVILADGFEDQP